MSDQRDSAAAPGSSGWPWDNPKLDLLILLVLFLIAIASAGVKRVVPAKPVARTIQLGAPQLVPMSEEDTSDAGRLLGSSLAQLVREGGEETP
ncbi:MAG: hypothetical protein ACLQBX_04855 [Candidatus Limnocylindrales bacterium]